MVVDAAVRGELISPVQARTYVAVIGLCVIFRGSGSGFVDFGFRGVARCSRGPDRCSGVPGGSGVVAYLACRLVGFSSGCCVVCWSLDLVGADLGLFLSSAECFFSGLDG